MGIWLQKIRRKGFLVGLLQSSQQVLHTQNDDLLEGPALGGD
jgi:hypothetical protein